ncbi:phospholipid phosphatase-related protein type 2 isoform X7 [Peromyscus leucopus]|uniref:phospholipid phosphatase-related protein type 2 isoform X7 n=1 Tax=Peromyscus leucopus TaxID=10041 RepID=UPI001885951C|nr:phospholipid phosphatase-related protein type 2 isoform X7 [Peromyscus leucopus]
MPSRTPGLRLPAGPLPPSSMLWSLLGLPSRSCWGSWPAPSFLLRPPPVLSVGRAPSCLEPAAASAPHSGGWSVSWVRDAAWGVYSFGLFTTTIFANAGQVVTGNPTPHFLSVCRPNYTALGCPPPSPDRPGPDRFVTDQSACAGSPSLVAAARRAFPCKDAALCAYAVTYTAMYVTLVFRVKGSRLVKPSLCLALLCPAFLVGVVRVAEYRNHWSDVLAGFLTGAAIATFLVTCVVHNFQSRPPSGRRLSPWEDLSQAPTMDSPLEKLSVAQEPETCRPHSTPARLTPSKPQNCARRGHLIPSCVSSRAPAMCSSPRVPRPRLRSEPTPLPLPLPLPAPTPSQGPSPSSPGPGGPGGGGGRGRKLLLPTPLLRDLYTLSGLHPSPFHRDNFSPYLFASRDHLL